MNNLDSIAATVHRSVLLELTARRNELAAIPAAPVDGMRRNSAAMADSWVGEKFQQLQAAKHHKAYDERAIRDHAENYATRCATMKTLDGRRSFGASVGVSMGKPKKAKGETEAMVRASQREIEQAERQRWDDPMWWRRQLRKEWTRQSEDALREIGVIRKGKQPYASDAAVEHRAGRIYRTREWMQSREMVSEQGDALPLIELHEKSIASPKIRRQEFMCRVRGFEEFADSQGHIALFWTMTTPSRFHAHHSGGGMNEKWKDDRARVRDAQDWLCLQWARARSKLGRMGMSPYGVRVAEPHHDATPHWHALLWLPAAHADAVREVLHDVWLKDSGDEDGAQLRRITCKEIDRSKGSAVGYIAKYIAKNIDGAGAAESMIDDETGEPVGRYVTDVKAADAMKEVLASSVHRAAAWASVHSIRQFQQIGGPPVGLWREFRRMREPLQMALLESIRAPVESGEWAEFIGALGGIERARRRIGSVRSKYSRTLRLPKIRARRLAATQWSRKHGPRVVWHMRDARPNEMPAAWLDRAAPYVTDVAGREVLAVTRYGEQPEPRAAGVCSYGAFDRYNTVDTRTHRWRIEKKCSTSALGSTSQQATAGGQLESHGDISSCAPHGCMSESELIRQDGRLTLEGVIPALDSRSDLGPVAITVRETASSISDGPGLDMMTPYRERIETARGGPFVGPPRPLAWACGFVGPPDPRNRSRHIRSEDDFRRLAWLTLVDDTLRH